MSLFTGKAVAFLISGPWSLADIKKAGIQVRDHADPWLRRGQARPAVRRACRRSTWQPRARTRRWPRSSWRNYVTKPELAKALYEAEPLPPALTAALDAVKATDPDAVQVL